MLKNYPTVSLKLDKKRLAKQFFLALLLPLFIVGAMTQLAKFSPASISRTSGKGPTDGNRSADSLSIAEFKGHLQSSFPEKYKEEADGIVSVAFRKNSIYRLDAKTSYQEIITPNSLIKTIVLHRLDNIGIEYQVTQSADTSGMAWVISWGGLLYYPEL